MEMEVLLHAIKDSSEDDRGKKATRAGAGAADGANIPKKEVNHDQPAWSARCVL